MKPETSPTVSRPRPRRFWRRFLLLAGPVVLVVASLIFYLHSGRYVSSDNAFVRADKLTIAAEVSGTVRAIAVKENEPVTAGQELFRLDDEAPRIALAEAQAKLAVARNDLVTLAATYREKTAAIASARERLAYAERQWHREQSLAAQNVSSEEKLDQARHEADAARDDLVEMEQEAQTVLISLGGSADAPVESHPRYRAAQSAVAQAERALRLTVVRAPQSGIVTNVTNLQVGQYLAATAPAFSLVVVDHVWIEANLKETELTHVAAGAPVAVELDTYPGRTWQGRVATISPASGAEFALIPPQNASGNWVKVVQRIPVEVELDTDPAGPALRTGMSATVEIDTGHQRSLRDLAHQIAGWFGAGSEPDRA